MSKTWYSSVSRANLKIRFDVEVQSLNILFCYPSDLMSA